MNMNSQAAVDKLVERLEAATDDDADLFWAAYKACFDNGEFSSPFRQASHRGRFIILCGKHAYLDAIAMLLDPRALWAIGSMEEGPFARVCWPMPDGGYAGGYQEAKAATVPIALCIANLRSRTTHD